MVRLALFCLGALLLFTGSAQNTGEEVYRQFCASCHQAQGQGVLGQFPPFAGHLRNLLRAPEGHTYLIHVVLFGLQGPITVQGQAYNAPPFTR